MIIVDSSLIIDFLRSSPRSLTWFYSLTGLKDDLAVSVLTHTEIFSGKSVWENDHAKAEAKDLFSELKIIPLTLEISYQAGEFVAKTNIDIQDAVIAATATVTSSSLATLNPKHFSSIPRLTLLKSPTAKN